MLRFFLVMGLIIFALTACGKEESPRSTEQSALQEKQTPQASPPEASVSSAGPIATNDPATNIALGERYYQRGCASCHDSGAAGAPRLGDVKSWEPRIAVGLQTLVRHAIDGFTGEAGHMPPRGGNPRMRAEAVALATHYLVKKSSAPDSAPR